MLRGRHILLCISGGIAAYKSLELIRRLRDAGADVRCVLSRNAHHFITPLAAAALSENPVHTDLFSLSEEAEMSHIRMSQEADLVVVAPASADLLAKMATGLADDLASTALLASAAPVLVAPAMNIRMWHHPATQQNLKTLRERGVHQVGPNDGDLACGDTGAGRMAEAHEILAAVAAFFRRSASLKGRRAVVTSGPTYEPIDPVRCLGNRSSGKQGHAIAGALAARGAQTVLITGPTALPDPQGVTALHVETAQDMLSAAEQSLPADIVVCAAAVADWRPVTASPHKIKKTGGAAPIVELVRNPDILARLAAHPEQRPTLVVGFAAETDDLLKNATAKLTTKGCDWIVANDVSPSSGTFGGDSNTVHLVSSSGSEPWPPQTKLEVADRLADRIAAFFEPADPVGG